MSRPPKLKGSAKGTVSELTRLKALAAEARAEIYGWSKEAGLTNEAVRERIRERWGVRLTYDGQLSDFWSWQYRQMVWDRWNQEADAKETELLGSMSRDEARDQTIKWLYAKAAAEQDDWLSLKTVDRDLKDKVVTLDSRRLAILEKKAQQADQAKELLGDKSLSQQEREHRMRACFGM